MIYRFVFSYKIPIQNHMTSYQLYVVTYDNGNLCTFSLFVIQGLHAIEGGKFRPNVSC